MWRNIYPYRDGTLPKTWPRVHNIKEAWKRLLSVPLPEALALPNHVEQTTSEPMPIWIIATIRDLYKQKIVPERIQFVLTRSPQEWCNHTRDIYHWLCSRHDLKCFARFQEVSNRALVNAFIMSGLYFTHPMPASCSIINKDSTTLSTA